MPDRQQLGCGGCGGLSFQVYRVGDKLEVACATCSGVTEVRFVTRLDLDTWHGNGGLGRAD